jgi:DNA invertase Pin-like site-specific DNA recombinase
MKASLRRGDLSNDLAAENSLLRREIEQIKQRLAELERKMPKEKVIVLREISREQAKQEIQQLFSRGRTLYYSDIAEELRLDLQLVVDICRELEENGEVKVEGSAL